MSLSWHPMTSITASILTLSRRRTAPQYAYLSKSCSIRRIFSVYQDEMSDTAMAVLPGHALPDDINHRLNPHTLSHSLVDGQRLNTPIYPPWKDNLEKTLKKFQF